MAGKTRLQYPGEILGKHVSGRNPGTGTAIDYPRPSQRSFRGNHIDTALGNAVSGKVREFVSEHELTEDMLFLSAYALLLGEYTGQEDIVVGSPASGRTHPETQEMIGMFVNTLALRCQMNREQTVREYLSEMKERKMP